MTGSHTIRVDRRTTLGWLGAVTALSASGISLSLGGPALATPEAQPTHPAAVGYGNDPNLFDRHVPWPRTMTPAQLDQTAALADLILPKVGTYPAPSEVGIADFVDEWISAPYPDQLRDRGLILEGLAWLDSEAQRLWQSDFHALDAPQKMQLLARTAQLPAAAGDIQAMKLYGFFRRLRSVVVGAYYSMQQNHAEIGYIGNIAMEAFPPPTAEENAFIDRAIAKLNL
jgi:hypothetical protein